MGIVEEDIARVRSATDMAAVVGEYVQLKKVGHRFSGLCPFHAEKSPSFSVNAVDGLYYCFGCQASGDAITFVREMEHVGFAEAVERLAAKCGITLTYDNPQESEGRQKRKKIAGTIARAEDWYHDRLLSSPDASGARKYLRDRGFDGEEVRRWKLGWAPDAWDELSRALKLSTKDLEATGLGKKGSRGGPLDHFRGRVLFPIHDADGTPIGFGGRIMPGKDGPKYINTGQTALYDKSRVLFALDMAKAGIVGADEVIVCEGYTDVIAFFRVGLPRAVATCGTALTDEHVALLRKFARRIVLAFDADGAGQAAAEKFYAWEQKFDLDVVVAAMPAGVDPAELAGTDADALRSAVSEARPFLEFRLQRAFEAADFDSPEHRARAAGVALAIVAEHPNDLVRDQYVMQIATRCQVDPAKLREQLRRGVTRPGPAPERRTERTRASTAADGDPGPSDPGAGDDPGNGGSGGGPGGSVRSGAAVSSPAIEVLRLAVNRPADVVEWLDEALFDDPLHLETYRLLMVSETIHEAIENATPDVASFLSRLAVEDCVDDARDPVVLLIRNAGRRALRAVRAEPDPDLAVMSKLAVLVDRVGLDAPGLTAAEELLAFVSSRGVAE